jgi:hypothetical protein
MAGEQHAEHVVHLALVPAGDGHSVVTVGTGVASSVETLTITRWFFVSDSRQ